jgi:hypothetical protein
MTDALQSRCPLQGEAEASAIGASERFAAIARTVGLVRRSETIAVPLLESSTSSSRLAMSTRACAPSGDTPIAYQREPLERRRALLRTKVMPLLPDSIRYS